VVCVRRATGDNRPAGKLSGLMSVDTRTRAPRTRRTLHDFEAAFRAEAVRERERLAAMKRDARQRSLRRRAEQTRRRGQVRFVGLVASMVATAVLVTVVMLNTLAWLLG
jgi:ferric-dicitrate binding protein FerR (iron transport regulator)